MAAYTQDRRRIGINTPLGQDVLVLASVEGTEQISRPFCYEVRMISEDHAIDHNKIVGQNVAIAMMDSDDQPRYVNGIVRKFVNQGRGDQGSMYAAEIVPWLWFLTRNSDCRIFQDMTIPQIIEQVLQSLNLNDFDLSGLNGQYAKLDYCVQYQETDFQFISRLMEREGIYYYFSHEVDRHVLMLGDHAGAYQDCKDSQIRFTGSLGFEDVGNQIVSWEHCYEFRSGRVAAKDFNFESPSQPMLSKDQTVVRLKGNSDFELFEYPGGYGQRSEGDQRVRLRMQEEEVAHDVVSGKSKCRSFGPGYKFTVTEHNCAQEEGKSFVITSVEHRASAGSYVTGGKKPEGYQNKFQCIPASVVCRPGRVTPKPQIRGPQSAVVVGPSGEEIYTDKHGRIKVQFHWDRYGKYDEKSSCWMRVTQNLAGKKWGAINIPRIGQEVIVEFMEGDPDRPIVTGRVYNGDTTPPYELPKHATMSTFKTNSSKGGEGFNEIRMEDKKDSEQLFIHAQRDMDIRVRNDRREIVENNRHLIVKTDKHEHVEHNRNEEVDADHMEKIGKDRHLSVEGKEAVQITGSKSLTVKGNVIEVFKADHSEQVTGDYYVKGTNLVIEGSSNVTIKVGQSYIAIEAGGIKLGTTGEIVIESMGQAAIKGTAGLKLESPAMAELKSTSTTVKGDAMTTIQGGLVKIN